MALVRSTFNRERRTALKLFLLITPNVVDLEFFFKFNNFFVCMPSSYTRVNVYALEWCVESRGLKIALVRPA